MIHMLKCSINYITALTLLMTLFMAFFYIYHVYLVVFLWVLSSCFFQTIIDRADVNQSKDLTLAEFVNYVQEHEKKLLLVFHALDANSDGEYFLRILIILIKIQAD